jgi:predicted DNA-binding antitoxin AbrB/MazE fold protein
MESVINTKVCVMCGIRKPLSDFNLKSGEKFVYESNCKDCERKKSLDNLSYIKTKKEIIDTQKKMDKPFPSKEVLNKTIRKLKIH